ncbi:CinA-like protein [bacterium HR17]|uniref:CinA-like protein n=1 Tax=Candidatus Fervidibacter japonicus TaxID=2035412 RepID=A0A2H5XFM5_9BACT|nr:CinA-like protein [bacterium HR17]
MKVAEIIAVGNELLIGDVLDTNTHWLCRRLTRMGVTVRRAVLVRDDEDAIAAEVRGALQRDTDLLVTSGGLGPTDDDRTVAAVAKAVGRPLELNEQALQMVTQRYRDLYERGFVDTPEVTPARGKMALLPAGATPLFNPVGTAPGVWLPVDTTILVCLPGVPAELKGIFEQTLPPLLQQVLGAGHYTERTFEVTCRDESVLAPLLKQVADRHPSVYIKSKARVFGDEVRITVLMAASGSDKATVEQTLQAAVDDLAVTLEPHGVVLIPKAVEQELPTEGR